MEFSEQYLTYEEYRSLGGTLDLTPFNILEFESRRQIDIRTFNRLKDIEEIPQEVKICEYNLINSINNYYNSTTTITENSNVKSESIDGYSVSYINASEISNVIKSKKDEIDDIVKTYLLGIIINGQHIMYCGVK